MHTGQTIPFISDLGAHDSQPIFVAGSALSMFFLNLSCISERWLRGKSQLMQYKGYPNTASKYLSLLFAVLGSLGLILSSIFDNVQHPHMHHASVAMFL
ncbi:hypothetical protein FE257_001592 [Aspergillus nanangensis]|uniref:CWH43-like N-terminal domain-containing protein n=1 Tax=Aspergillus nanangensis TaxID=2582783 RepID=A0AAD4GYC6_ASPNN|nr:hypothetical protein FE257_001592 [Aspergillus nanangensis]